jgi:MFS family permease
VSSPTGSPFPALIFRIGRKPLLRGGSAVMTISHLLTALLVCLPRILLTISTSIRRPQIFEFGSEWENHPIAAWVAVRYVLGSVQYVLQGLTRLISGVYLFTVAYGVSFGPISWVLPNEVFPLSMRGKGAALSTASNWSNNCTSRTHCLTSNFLTDNEMLQS